LPENLENALFLRGGEICPDQGLVSLAVLAAYGPVRLPAPGSGFIFAADSVAVEGQGAFVVSDGEAQVGSAHAGGADSASLIIARKDITLGGAEQCLVLAGGRVRIKGWLRDCVIVSGKDVVAEESPQHAYKNCTIKQHQPDPFGFVRFFDPVQEGITVEGAREGLRVKAVAAGKPFALAGVRPGDMIVAVDGDDTDAPEVFRRQLRRAWVAEEGAALRIIRGGKTEEIWVAAPR
jgi:membrane-associated protease RseP (regulator of RpoE activity)